jgi:aryl-alcohol dehydrogenase-like predicted oxidoreductase
MLDPVWHGCFRVRSPNTANGSKTRKCPFLSWSSQARGFLRRARRARMCRAKSSIAAGIPMRTSSARTRGDLAQEKGVLPINIALAYVLCQPFPTFTLVGPKRRSEITSTMTALDIELSPPELAWLDLRAETPHP